MQHPDQDRREEEHDGVLDEIPRQAPSPMLERKAPHSRTAITRTEWLVSASQAHHIDVVPRVDEGVDLTARLWVAREIQTAHNADTPDRPRRSRLRPFHDGCVRFECAHSSLPYPAHAHARPWVTLKTVR